MEYNKIPIKYRKGTHRGVAPIIATLLMVAIAVVGGVLIYVYTQGFFANTSTTTVSSDVLSLTGYDLAGGNLAFDGTSLGTADTTPNAGKVNGDTAVINVRNIGGAPLKIGSIKVDGVGAKIDTAAKADAVGEASVHVAAGALASEGVIIPTGGEASIYYWFSNTVGPDKTIDVEVATQGGGEFTFKVTEKQRK